MTTNAKPGCCHHRWSGWAAFLPSSDRVSRDYITTRLPQRPCRTLLACDGMHPLPLVRVRSVYAIVSRSRASDDGRDRSARLARHRDKAPTEHRRARRREPISSTVARDHGFSASVRARGQSCKIVADDQTFARESLTLITWQSQQCVRHRLALAGHRVRRRRRLCRLGGCGLPAARGSPPWPTTVLSH